MSPCGPCHLILHPVVEWFPVEAPVMHGESLHRTPPLRQEGGKNANALLAQILDLLLCLQESGLGERDGGGGRWVKGGGWRVESGGWIEVRCPCTHLGVLETLLCRSEAGRALNATGTSQA